MITTKEHSKRLGYMVGREISLLMPSEKYWGGQIEYLPYEEDESERLTTAYYTAKREGEPNCDQLWDKYLEYSNNLIKEYFPHSFSYLIPVSISGVDRKEFMIAVDHALWDCDYCVYNTSSLTEIEGFGWEIKLELGR